MKSNNIQKNPNQNMKANINSTTLNPINSNAKCHK